MKTVCPTLQKGSSGATPHSPTPMPMDSWMGPKTAMETALQMRMRHHRFSPTPTEMGSMMGWKTPMRTDWWILEKQMHWTTDADGLSDGHEDSNKNGLVDLEADPRLGDTDNDGITDSLEVWGNSGSDQLSSIPMVMVCTMDLRCELKRSHRPLRNAPKSY